MPGSSPTVAELGEREVLARILPLLPKGRATLVPPGDDCAVVAAPAGTVCITTDTMLEGADFRLEWSSWHDLGVKAAATNLADIAAMGATPTALVVALAVPGSTPVASLTAFARGLADGIDALAPGCGVVGGDLSTAATAVIAVTALGDLGARAAVVRSGARVGDRVVVAGRLGLAGEGLALLYAEALNDADAASRLRREHADAVEAQLAPRPPIAQGAVLATAGATAMCDVSDGLAIDADRIAEASGVRIALSADALMSANPSSQLEHVLHGGEDHALLATLPAGAPLPDGVAVVGVVEDGAGVTLDGAPLAARGWDPYRH